MYIGKLSLVAALILPVSALGVVGASPAGAMCTSAADMTVCSESGLGPEAITPMPVYPYPCEYDWYCSDGGMSLMFDPTLRVGEPGSGGLNASRDRPGGSYLD
ncbi:MAG: hypothetical protein WBB07_02995 [Mycobacterium sp.]